MRCPVSGCGAKTARVLTGTGKLDYILACFNCSWQVAIRELEAWLKRWQ